jgi:hypothetical protein
MPIRDPIRDPIKERRAAQALLLFGWLAFLLGVGAGVYHVWVYCNRGGS